MNLIMIGHEVSWRLNRYYELKVSKNKGARDSMERQSMNFSPNRKMLSNESRKFVHRPPSVLECLQDGFAEGRERNCFQRQPLHVGSKGCQGPSFHENYYQHRMHSEISAFSRREFYENSALNDAIRLIIVIAIIPLSIVVTKSIHGLMYQAGIVAGKMIKK